MLSSYSSRQRIKSVKDYKNDNTLKSDKSKKAVTKDEESSKYSNLSHRKSHYLIEILPRIRQLEKSLNDTPKKQEGIREDIRQIYVNCLISGKYIQ